MTLSIVIAACAKTPERVVYLKRNIASLRKHWPDAEILVGFDKFFPENPSPVDLDVNHVYCHKSGLGRSFNWGIETATHEVILQMEEDWMCNWCQDGKPESHKVIKISKYAANRVLQDPSTFVRLDNMRHDWYKPGSISLGTEESTDRELFQLNKINDLRHWQNGYNPYFYSNHPHIKHRSFHRQVGDFTENVSVPKVELDMCRKVLFNHNSKCLFFEGNCFGHIGDMSVREQK